MSALRSRFDFRPGTHVKHPMRWGTIVLVAFLAFLFWGYTGGKLPFTGGGYNVKAVFASGEDLRGGKTPVRVNGVNVGSVTSTQRTPDGKAVIATMHITDSSVHLTNMASAQVYWRTLLGFNYYIDINPGHGSTSLGSTTIPESRTGVQVELDQVLEALTPKSRGGIQQTFGQLSTAFAPGNQAGAAIDNVAPAMKNVGPALQGLRGEYNGDLSNTVTQANRLLDNLARSDAQLGGLVDNSDTTLGATNAQQASIDATLQQAPETLSATYATMVKVNHTLKIADPVVDSLDPGAKAIAPAATTVRPTLRRLIPLLNQARPTLVSLRPALAHLGTAGKVGTPVLKRLIPTFNTLNKSVLPGLEAKGFTGLKMYEAIGPVFATVDSSAERYDANGHIQRFQALAAGANSLSALPCNLDLTDVKLNCSDFQTVLGDVLGLGGTSTLKSSDATLDKKGASH